MANIFDSIKIKNPKRNKFSLSHSSRLTTEFGRLTPILCEPVLPADQFKVNTTLKIRFAPMTLPVMERFKAYVHYWFVPNRLVWDNWETFITGGESGVEDLEHPYPVIKCGPNLEGSEGSLLSQNFLNGSLFDYLGFPARDTVFNAVEKNALKTKPQFFDALPFKAYQLIYNEFYRDQNVTEKFDIHTEKDGVQDMDDDNAFENALMSLRYRAFKKDYFTSALPDPQRGPEVTLPFYGDLEINGTGDYIVILNKAYALSGSTEVRDIVAHSEGGQNLDLGVVAPGAVIPDGAKMNIMGAQNADNVAAKLEINNGETRMASINDIRRGFALQRLYELAARVGGRYVENILGNFGVFAGDSRLQRPEYLGGSVVPVYVGDVLQTSESTVGGTPLGMPAGVAGAVGGAKAFSRTFKEHGWIIGILSIMPEATYFQGVPRKFLKRDRLDFAWPLFANIGEQEIQNQELFLDWRNQNDKNEQGFGYTPRYAEYRFGQSGIHGDFRGTLVDFHDARMFDSLPALNEDFIKCKPSGNHTGLNRIFAVNTEEYDHLWVYLYNDILVRRKLPKYGTPI